MPIVCKYCILTEGLRGSDIHNLSKTKEEFMQHIEREHYISVRRAGETFVQAVERFQRENPDVGTERCKCPTCLNRQSVLKIVKKLWSGYRE